MSLNPFTYSMPGDVQADVDAAVTKFRDENAIARVWQKEASVWTGDDEAKWLGWLEIVGNELANVSKYRDLQRDIESGGFTDVLLMGMGGSSLCPEVLAFTFGKTNFHILDSTVPSQVRSVEAGLDLERTLFIVASKSGSTLEPNCFKQYFFERVAEKVGREEAGRRFVAITDPGSKMEQVAKGDNFRHIFSGNPEVGGRFSALSAFGMTAAASMGLDVEAFLRDADEMVSACRLPDPSENPGALLGLIMGACHAKGRDKLTIFSSPEIFDLGAWMEQLIAESTGKIGVAIVPVDREPPIDASLYGNDRFFAYVTVGGDDRYASHKAAVEAAGHPTMSVDLETIDSLGQEFFRWEFATAIAGAVMQINPFNQPDVEAAKIEARKITDKYEETGRLPDEKPFAAVDGLQFFAGDDYAARLGATGSDASAILKAHLGKIGAGDYFGLLAYVEMNKEHEDLCTEIRETILRSTGTATCLGFGPRFLHSTGQAYKGGANNGVFLQITSDDADDLEVPGQKYTFGVVKAAQARGDFQVLVDRGRRALRVHLSADVTADLKKLTAMISDLSQPLAGASVSAAD